MGKRGSWFRVHAAVHAVRLSCGALGVPCRHVSKPKRCRGPSPRRGVVPPQSTGARRGRGSGTCRSVKVFFLLVADLQAEGPIQKTWQDFSRLEGDRYHCHLSYRYVACWTCWKTEIVIGVYYVGSRELGVRQNMISDYERGRRTYSDAMANRLGKVLQVREEHLRYGSEQPAAADPATAGAGPATSPPEP